MMNIKIISVGKLKEKYLVQGISEYTKRLSKYCKITLVEVPDEKAPEKLSDAEMIQVKEKEGERILAKIKEQEYVFALAINGENREQRRLRCRARQIANQRQKPIRFCHRRLTRTK